MDGIERSVYQVICFTCHGYYTEGFSECGCPICQRCGCKFEEDPDKPYWHLCPECDDETEPEPDDGWPDQFVCNERKHGDAQPPLF